jgi:photosynthetic reaction center cytochrome c subunit
MFRVHSIAIAASLMFAATVVSAQDTRPAETVYKNIKVMKGVPANQIIQGMHLIKAALGVDCTHCHIEMEWDREDVQPMKDKARAMYVMLTEINRANFEGKKVVTCFTCHKGHAIPEDIPAMPVPPIKAELEAAVKAVPVLPTVDQVLSKYITALGGEQAMRKVTTRVITGTQDLPTGPGGTVPTPAKLERSLKAPNLVVDVYTADKFTISSGFDGKAQWAKGQNGNVNSPIAGGVDAERAQRAAAFNEPLTLKQQYTTLTVDGIARVNGHDAYVVIGTPAANTPERLYFDTRTGLLLRKWTYVDTASGRSPYQLDFDDYRNTGSGVKIPFVVHMSPAGPRTEIEPTSTLRITSVKDNTPIDNAKFVKPMPTPQPAAR